jgi:hypothetical protein
VRPFVQGILEQLLARHRDSGHVHLNDLAEVIGAQAITYDEVELLITCLEQAGLRVGEPLDARDIHVMHEVLASARKLRETLSRPPTVNEIATASGYAPHVVWRALEYGKSASRPPV